MNNEFMIKIFERILKESKEEELQEDDLNEFSGVGAIGGFTGPLGAPVPDVGEPILKATKRKKKNARR
jgi:hypothetical protein